MPWLQLQIRCRSEDVETLSDVLEDFGAVSVSCEDALDEPLYEPPPGTTPLWSQTRIIGLFEADTELDAVAQHVKRQYPEKILSIRSDILEDKDWVRAWMDRYQPMQFGEQLWIVPSHHTPPDPSAVNILLDPGLAFGTGTHPTTAMCLTWLAEHPPRQQQVTDYGCGSGILAIAAARLGARHVEAIDNDPQALQATRSNARTNAVAQLIECKDPLAKPAPCDTLLANILAGPLISLAPRFSEFTRPGANIVLSGILQAQAEMVIQACQPWFTLTQAKVQDDWVLLTGTRNIA